MPSGTCPKCRNIEFLTPLHGDNGGPLMCWKCGGVWHAKNTRRRKAGRAAIKALKVYFDTGGKDADVAKLKLAAGGLAVTGEFGDTSGTEPGEMTGELLNDILLLAHPDRHPSERNELATRVTHALLALRPYVFPEPETKPRSKPEPAASPLSDVFNRLSETLKAMHSYPCMDCASEAPMDYCASCRIEYDRRHRAELDRNNATRRKLYAKRHALASPLECVQCGSEFKTKRRDARYCSPACRQKSHRQRVTADCSSECAPHLSVTAA